MNKSNPNEHQPHAGNDPTDAQVNSACMSYRHDFGLLPPEERKQLQFKAREWLHAWLKEGVGCDRNEVIERCAAVVDQANREGPYQAIAAASRIRALKANAETRPSVSTGSAVKDDVQKENSDKEIWRGPDEGNGNYYADSMFVTQDGKSLGINCGGYVRVQLIRQWHALPALDMERLRVALEVSRDCILESFEYVDSKDDQLLADARLLDVEQALAQLSIDTTSSRDGSLCGEPLSDPATPLLRGEAAAWRWTYRSSPRIWNFVEVDPTSSVMCAPEFIIEPLYASPIQGAGVSDLRSAFHLLNSLDRTADNFLSVDPCKHNNENMVSDLKIDLAELRHALTTPSTARSGSRGSVDSENTTS